MKRLDVLLLFMVVCFRQAAAQTCVVTDSMHRALPFATVTDSSGTGIWLADSSGAVHGDFYGVTALLVFYNGQLAPSKLIQNANTCQIVTTVTKAYQLELVDIVIAKADKQKKATAFNTDILQAAVFRAAGASNLFEASAAITGLRSQITCNVCNTGEIRINGMDGPYTAILTDDVPCIGGLSAVYGLTGIPISIIESVEITKGPAPVLYGAEAMAGVLNLVTKHPGEAARLSIDYLASSYREHQLEISSGFRLKRQTQALLALTGNWYNQPVDKNKDGFTDISLLKRTTAFLKVFKSDTLSRVRSFQVRGHYESRWGGQMNWQPEYWASDSIYGEAIELQRAEATGRYDWFSKETLRSDFYFNFHNQAAAYGNTVFLAKQITAFTQTRWKQTITTRNTIRAGQSLRYLYYDDNTPATLASDTTRSKADKTWLAGLFVNDEQVFGRKDQWLFSLGSRMDWHSVFGFIPSPRAAIKLEASKRLTFRLNAGSGFRVVNVFTEDHAALSGARKVVFLEKIRPEKSTSMVLNIQHKLALAGPHQLIIDANLFYYFFSNKIIADYSRQSEIVFSNLSGFAYSRGGSISCDYPVTRGLSATAAYVYTDAAFKTGSAALQQQWYSPKHTARLSLSYFIPVCLIKTNLNIDYTGAQRLPILQNDFRPEYSPAYWLCDVQLKRKVGKQFDLTLTVKNILNFLPQSPLMRPFDPFNKTSADAITNPNAYVFDTAYNYAPMQGRRAILQISYTLN